MRRSHRLLACLLPTFACLAASPPAVWAQDAKAVKDLSAQARQDDPLAGHSAHGEAFNEGPRQQAHLMGGTGNVHLKVTTSDLRVQKFFDQGVGQLHGFWTFEAERSFRQAAALDPDCAMAYWGMAMANFGNAKRSQGFIAEAVKRRSRASRREQLWINGLNAYVNSKKDKKTKWTELLKSFDDILVDFPDELEAKAFLAWAKWRANRNGVPFRSYTSVNSVIGQVLEQEPLHPVHHYRIHLWDYKKPERALRSAALCGPAAPTIAHMWHMPGHIYWRLKRYHDSAYQQEASARADHAQMVRDRVLPYQISNYAHNNEWLCRSLSNVGRVHDAIELAKNMVELPRHPKLNAQSKRGSSAAYGRTRLLQVLLRWEMWKETIDLCQTVYLEPTDIATEQIKQMRALGQAYMGKGDVENGKRLIAEIQKRLADTKAKQLRAGEEAERKAREAKKSQREITKARTNARRPYNTQVSQWNTALNELRGRLAMLEGRHEEGLPLLAKTSGMLKEHLSQFYLQAGQHDKALQVAKQAKDSGQNQVYPLANYVDVLHRCGRKEEARTALEQLRKHAQDLDLDVRVARRLASVAESCDMPVDWRLPRETPGDLGQRPKLDTLGPFRWHPVPAEDWSLPGTGPRGRVSLADYRGKPVLVIFYLGYGCLHCAEQIDKFAPMADQFRNAGIELVAISSDSTADLKKSIDRYERETPKRRKFPFPLAADPELTVFRRYRTYDDFEKMALHGTFLIDGQGLVRWQDVSYDPFMEAEFLLKEAQRLLKQPAP